MRIGIGRQCGIGATVGEGMTEQEFIAAAMGNPANPALLARLRPLALPQCHLAAGCLFQPVWNRAAGRAPGWGVRDYDVFYFDDRDLSWEAEDAVIRRVAEATAALGLCVEVRNQARVHLWYERRFGAPCPPLASARHGIDRYLVECTCVGIEVATDALHAPHGLADLAAGVLRINARNAQPEAFRAKAASYAARWPFLTIIDPS
jgi:uncharacterized protein